MLQPKTQDLVGDDKNVAREYFNESEAVPPVPIAAPTAAINSQTPLPQPIAITAGGPTAYETNFGNQIAQSTNSASAGQAFDVDEHGHAVLDAVLMRDGVLPVVRNRIAPLPTGVSFRVIPATIDDLEAVTDLGVLAVALNKNMVRGDNARTLALLTKVKDLNPAGMAAYAWGTSPLVPPPPPKPKARGKPRRSGPRVVFPDPFAAITDQVASELNERTPTATAPMEVGDKVAEHVPSIDDDDAVTAHVHGADNA